MTAPTTPQFYDATGGVAGPFVIAASDRYPVQFKPLRWLYITPSEQADLLRSIQCNQAQGYLYSQPVSAEEFGELLARERLIANRQEFQPLEYS